MTIEPGSLVAISLAYLGLLFLIAYVADSGRLPVRLLSNPFVYSLSLGVYATSWTYYGSVGLADRSGYAFLTIYLGLTGAFLLGPRLLAPLLALCREHQLTSIADLLAFRYGGRVSGTAVTLFMLIGILPYLSLQIRAVTESLQVLTLRVPPDLAAAGFCVVITVFAVLFGARHFSPREKHRGLVVAIAFESAVKLAALLVAALFIVTQVFDSPRAMTDWANQQPEMVASLYEPAATGLWTTLLLLSFSAAFLLPRQYHMTFVENEDPAHLRTAYWLFPLYLLLLNLPIVPILFAGRFLELGLAPDFYVLGITRHLGHEWLAILVFLGGLSAASAMMIVTTLALSSMCLNHLLLPAWLGSNREGDVYRRILWSKRVIIALIVAAGYGFYIVIELDAGEVDAGELNKGLASLGLISFVAAAQLLPGVIGLLFWSRATQQGFVAGLVLGAGTWFGLLILPLIAPTSAVAAAITGVLDGGSLGGVVVDTDIWSLSTFCSLSANALGFIIGSLALPPSEAESVVGDLTAERGAAPAALALAGPDIARSGVHYRYAMQQVLGKRVAREEFLRALDETGIDERETRVAELRLLHERLERNLTGLLGPVLARDILSHRRPGDAEAEARLGDEIVPPDARLLELRLEASRERMRGMTKQLDDLRRYLTDVLGELPVGVCSTDSTGRVYLWNAAMQRLTGIDARAARDTPLDRLPAPWGATLARFAASDESALFRQRVRTADGVHSLNLQRADVRMVTAAQAANDATSAGQVLLLEDRTQLDSLENELAHNERLASIGRLAAGVAHEIGNPLTGIASLAQNLRYDAHAAHAAHAARDAAAAAELVGEQADDILVQVTRIDSIVRSLLDFSHAGSRTPDVRERVDLAHCIDEALRLVRYAPETQRLCFETALEPGLQVTGDSNELTQVFVNLLNNACHASPDGGRVCVETERQHDDCLIRVRDEGSGIDPAARDRVFEPFYTTRAVGEGTGLGLSLVYSIVTNHGGRIGIDDKPGSGHAMLVRLPSA